MTRCLALLEVWMMEPSSPYVRAYVEVVIDDLYGRDSGSAEGVTTVRTNIQHFVLVKDYVV